MCWLWPIRSCAIRMALNFAARADGVTLDALIDRLCQPLA